MTATLGAEVTGVDLRADLDDDAGRRIHDALVQYGVLVFRDQAVDPATHLRLGEALGRTGPPHPLYPGVPGFPAISVIRNDAENPPENEVWHSDLSCRADPPFAAVLRGAVIPPVGGDTLWADMRAVCAALPAELRARLATLRARHTMAHGFRFLDEFGHHERRAELDREGSGFVAEHPVIVRHPISGVPVLYVNESFTESVVGEHPAAGAALLEQLFAMVRNPRFQMRLRWHPDTVVMWDNWATQHFACGDHFPRYERAVQRVTVLTSRAVDRVQLEPAS